MKQLEKTVEKLCADIKVANGIIAELMTGGRCTWESAVHLYDKFVSEGKSCDNSTLQTLRREFTKEIKQLKQAEEKRLDQARKSEEEWTKELSRISEQLSNEKAKLDEERQKRRRLISEQLSNEKSKLYDEKQKRRRLIQFQVDQHKRAVEELQCHITDLEIMIDKKNRLVNEVRLVCFRC